MRIHTLAAVLATALAASAGATSAEARVIPKRSIDGVHLRDSTSRVARLHGSRPRVTRVTFGPGEIAAVQWTYPRRKLTVVFLNRRVVEVATRSRVQRTSRGVRVGTSLSRARRRHPELRCFDEAEYRAWCEWGTGTSIRSLPFTQLQFRGGRVARILLGYSTP